MRRIARPLLAAEFIYGGLDSLRNPGPRVEAARPVLDRLSGPLHLPDDPELIIRANGAVMAGAGLLLATGRLPRLAGALLAATMVPTTWAGHPFWQEKDPATRRQQRVQFLKNMGLLGGVLLAAVDTEGRPGLAWRGRAASRRATEKARRAARDTRREARRARAEARRETVRALQAARAALPG